MENTVLKATARTEFGKGAARRARRAGLVPAVIYGHEGDPVHVDVDEHDLALIVRSNPNALVELHLEGGKKQLALVKDIQRHPLRRNLLHVDFLSVRAGEKVDVDVPVIVVGESKPGTVHSLEEFTLAIKAPANDIPENLEVDITGLDAGETITAADLKLPGDVELEVAAETVIVSVMVPEKEELPEPAAVEAPAEGDNAEAESKE